MPKWSETGYSSNYFSKGAVEWGIIKGSFFTSLIFVLLLMLALGCSMFSSQSKDKDVLPNKAAQIVR